MRVGHRQHLEHALNAAILAILAVQGVEHDDRTAATRRPQEFDQGPQVAFDLEFDDLVTTLAQPLGASLAAHQRHLALGRPAAHQDRDLTRHPSAPLRTGPSAPLRTGPSAPLRTGPSAPMRRISHSNWTPHFSRTRRRTSSPSASMSAALAPPRLIRKLQCLSETCASPMRSPRQPAWSISSHALWPGGLTKVEPPVRLRGCDSVRALSISAIRPAIAT